MAEMGVPARVLPMRKDCPDLDESTVVPLGQHYTLPQQNADGSVTLCPETAPPGYVMLLGARRYARRSPCGPVVHRPGAAAGTRLPVATWHPRTAALIEPVPDAPKTVRTRYSA